MPAESKGLAIVEVPRSYAELAGAVDDVHELWERLGGPEIASIAVDERSNGVNVNVVGDRLSSGVLTAAVVSSAMGVPVNVEGRRAIGGDVTQVCTDRDHCTNPMDAGIRMHGGSMNGNILCTVAFPIVFQGDIQSVSAGHCSHYFDLWYHPGYGANAFANVQDATLWRNGGRDILRMSFPDAQASEIVYGTPSCTACTSPGEYAGSSSAVLNEWLCISLGRSDRRDCGRVEHTSVKYWSNTIGFWVWGGDLIEGDIAPQPIDGDSGSPISRDVLISKPGALYWQHAPVGVLTTEFDEYSRLDNTLSDWNATIWKG